MALCPNMFCIDKGRATIALPRRDGNGDAVVAVPVAAERHLDHEGRGEERVRGRTTRATSARVRRRPRARTRASASASRWSGARRAAGARAPRSIRIRRVAGKCHDSGKSPMVAFHSATMNRGWGQRSLQRSPQQPARGRPREDGRITRLRDGPGRLRHGRQPQRVDRRPERHVPGRPLARHVPTRRAARTARSARVRLPRPTGFRR